MSTFPLRVLKDAFTSSTPKLSGTRTCLEAVRLAATHFIDIIKRVINSNVYLLTGVETISHLRENGRITVLFNAFEGPPRICRLFGTGKTKSLLDLNLSLTSITPHITPTGVVHEFGSPEYDRFISPENRRPGGRSVIVIDVHKVGTVSTNTILAYYAFIHNFPHILKPSHTIQSCGYAVPYFSFNSHRTQLLEFFQRHEKEEHAAELAEAAELPKPELSNAKNRPEKGIRQYWINKNLRSIDGLPGLHVAPFCDKPFRWSERDIERARELREKTAKEADKDKVNQQTPASSKQLDQREDYVRMTLAFAAGVATMAAYHHLVVRTW